jgi:hypothetical protein
MEGEPPGPDKPLQADETTIVEKGASEGDFETK